MDFSFKHSSASARLPNPLYVSADEHVSSPIQTKCVMLTMLDSVPRFRACH